MAGAGECMLYQGTIVANGEAVFRQFMEAMRRGDGKAADRLDQAGLIYRYPSAPRVTIVQRRGNMLELQPDDRQGTIWTDRWEVECK